MKNNPNYMVSTKWKMDSNCIQTVRSCQLQLFENRSLLSLLTHEKATNNVSWSLQTT